MAHYVVDRDSLGMVDREKAAFAALAALDAIQNLPPHQTVAGVSVLFAALCQRLVLDPEEMHALGRRLLRDQDHHRKENVLIDTLREFAGERLTAARKPG